MGLAANREWVYPQSVRGRFQRLHRWTGFALQAFLVVVPWINVGGHPAARFDLGARRVYLLGEVFTARDTPYLVLVGLFAAFSMFFFTSLFGRLWCGYVCPQTVFLEEWIRPLERWIEGERGVRIARDHGPWTWSRVWRRGAKWSAFLMVAGLVAMAFTSWFAGAHALWTGEAGSMAYGVTAALTGVMFLDFAWFREQFCNYLCPYARFQGALADEESLVVAYDAARGEPRRLLRGEQRPGATGDCIDCRKCVVACPQGIDIRAGYQLECITCGRCIDACTPIMVKQGKVSLVGYTALKKPRLVRPRTVAYGALLLVIATVFSALLATRSEVQASLARPPGALYVMDPDGFVRNTYLLRVTNTEAVAATYSVDVEGLPEGAEVVVQPLTVAPGEMAVAPLSLRVPPGAVMTRTLALTVTVASGDERASIPTTFKTPAAG